MRIPVYTRQFERDIKRVRKRGKNLEKFKIIARALIGGNKLDPLHRVPPPIKNGPTHRRKLDPSGLGQF